MILAFILVILISIEDDGIAWAKKSKKKKKKEKNGWVYHPPKGSRKKYEGVNPGLYCIVCQNIVRETLRDLVNKR